MTELNLFSHAEPLTPLAPKLRLSKEPDIYHSEPVASLRAAVNLEVYRPDISAFTCVQFRIDSGSGNPSMSLALAMSLGQEVNVRRGELSVTTATSISWLRVRLGKIKVRFPGSTREFEWTCHFYEDRPLRVPPMLGLHNVLDTLRVSFDSKFDPKMPYGAVIFQEYPPKCSEPKQPSGPPASST
jgi:hypothetical protein